MQSRRTILEYCLMAIFTSCSLRIELSPAIDCACSPNLFPVLFRSCHRSRHCQSQYRDRPVPYSRKRRYDWCLQSFFHIPDLLQKHLLLQPTISQLLSEHRLLTVLCVVSWSVPPRFAWYVFPASSIIRLTDSFPFIF